MQWNFRFFPFSLFLYDRVIQNKKGDSNPLTQNTWDKLNVSRGRIRYIKKSKRQTSKNCEIHHNRLSLYSLGDMINLQLETHLMLAIVKIQHKGRDLKPRWIINWHDNKFNLHMLVRASNSKSLPNPSILYLPYGMSFPNGK